jgi:hypothetical protein
VILLFSSTGEGGAYVDDHGSQVGLTPKFDFFVFTSSVGVEKF